MPRVFISDKLEKAGLDILLEAGIEVDNRPGLKGDELKQAIRQADGMVVRSGTRLTAELLEDPGTLRAVVATSSLDLGEGEATRRVFGALVSANYFSTLQVPLVRGRAFTPEEEKPGAAIPVAGSAAP